MMLFTAKKRISIHSLRMEGDASSSDARSRCFISIHSLRMEGDLVKKYNYSEYNISIHSLRMEGDEMSTVSEYVGEVFQSTPSAWRETIMYFVSKMEKLISIHSLRMEGDHIFESVLCEISNFNPLPPHGGRPYGSRVIQCPLNFNPLPPHGGRPVLTSILRSNPAFQSTPSAWRETSFSIKLSSDLIFQSTPSAWRETARQQIHAFLAVQFQSTPSAWRETWPPHMCRVVLPYFNPLPPHGGRLRLFQR